MNLAIALTLAIVVVALLLWWRHRRRAAEPSQAASPELQASQEQPSSPAASRHPTPAQPIPRLRPLLRRMYAVTMDTPALATEQPPTTGVHAQVLAETSLLLDRLDVQPQYMPRRPHLLPQLMRAVNDPEASSRGIAAVIAQDPALATNLLRIANSALYRPRDGHPVDSIERAVAQVGTEGVRQIVVAALMQPVLSLEGGLFKRLPAAIWDYALRTSAAAAHHARNQGSNDDALSAQLLGLLQGLGAVMVMRILGETYARQPGTAPSLAVAAALLERYTTATAQLVAAGWELPTSLVRALMDQRPDRDGRPPQTPVGVALRYGRLAAVLTVLVSAGEETEEQALAMLGTLQPDADANAELWARMTSHPASE